ncbi:HET-domain-containing protein [Lophium mytilinum]|uniref:HET-domain-containing protein n=1 Tax=Lophium mytilinum TaxID=390894 RepID=A0A6A6R7B2_9PEZI|nr:HET-domain-containing protein [Lophium mytilinum]
MESSLGDDATEADSHAIAYYQENTAAYERFRTSSPRFPVCYACWSITGTFNKPHHFIPRSGSGFAYGVPVRVLSLRESAKGCSMCGLFWTHIQKSLIRCNIAKSDDIICSAEAYVDSTYQCCRSFTGSWPIVALRLRFRSGSLQDVEGNKFEAYSLKGDVAARYLPKSPPTRDYHSDTAFSAIRTWLKDCEINHPPCQLHFAESPTRLIDVRPWDEHQEGLKLVSSHGKYRPYAALSYCWGCSLRTTTTTSNYREMCAGFSIKSLDKSIRDAVVVAWKLGFRYLWVDSLCIIQDDLADKKRELNHMGDIYKNALLTISAANSSKASHRFLRAYPAVEPDIVLPYACADGTTGWIHLKREPFASEMPDSILSRAWTLQESVLSRRLPIYTSFGQLRWQCRTVKLVDGGLNEDGQSLYEVQRPELAYDNQESPDPQDVIRQCREYVFLYTRQELTYVEDRPLAIDAIAKELLKMLPQDVEYKADLFSTLLAPQTDLDGWPRWKKYTKAVAAHRTLVVMDVS